MFFQKKKDFLHREFSDVASLDDIYWCFRLILGRPPSENEWHGHSGLAGRPLNDVVSTYITSKEFKERDTDYAEVSQIERVQLRGFEMLVPVNDPQVGVHIYESKVYEGNITDYVRKTLGEGDVFVDIGANIGYFTSLAASIVGPRGRVIAIEPGASNTKFLMLNKQINGFDQVEVTPAAASEKCDIMLYDSSASNGFVTEISGDSAEGDIARLFASDIVYAVTVDDKCRSLDKVDMIKIDIEGAEYLAMKGAINTIRKYQPIVISEFSPPALRNISNASPKEYLDFMLADTDYEISCFHGNDLVPCGRNVQKVIEQFDNAHSDHIDIVFSRAV